MGCVGQRSLSHEGPTLQVRGFKGSAVNVLVSESVLWSQCLDRSELFWWLEGDLHNITQIILLWLIMCTHKQTAFGFLVVSEIHDDSKSKNMLF